MLLALSLTVVVAGCGGQNTAGGGVGGGDVTNVSLSDRGMPVSSSIDRDATLRLMYTVAPTSLDPHMGSSSTDNTSLALAFDRLVHLSPDGKPVPGLATEWYAATDPPSLTMTLRQDVTFHDGTPFDADAAKANLDRARGDDSNVAGDLAAIDEVDVVEPYEIKIHLNQQAGALPLILSDRGGMMMSPQSFDNPDVDRAPVGSGMYRVTNYEVGVRIDLTRYEDYWDPEAAAARKVVLTFQADDMTRLNALLDGQADWTNVASADIEQVEQAGMYVSSKSDLAFYHLQLNINRSEFGNRLVREALNYAIDREAIADVLFDERATANVQPFPEGYFAYNPSVEDAYTYDPDKARELLAEAGLPDGFQFELLTAQLDTFVKVSEALQAQLGDVGIDVDIRVVPVNEVVQKAYLDKVGDAVMITFQARPDPSQTLGRLYSEGGETNPSGASTPGYMKEFERIAASTTERERVDAIHDTIGALVDESLDVVLLNANANYAVQPNVVNFVPYVTGKPEFRGVGIASSS